MRKWEYCTVKTFVTDWTGAYGPKGSTLRMFPSDPPQDFDSIDDALSVLGNAGWECFFLDQTLPGIFIRETTMRFKRLKD